MSAADNLRAARALIEDPKRWIRGAWGIDVNGESLSTQEIDEAVCFCSLGALARVGVELFATSSDEEQFSAEAVGDMGVADFNDNHTHAEVLAAFDKAIELAEAQK